MLGLCKVIPQEYPHILCQSVDISVPSDEGWQGRTADHLMAEVRSAHTDVTVAYRGDMRWVQVFEALPLDQNEVGAMPLRQGGVYLITGGLGGVGLELAGSLARLVKAKLILTRRATFPAPSAWDQWLAEHDEQDAVSRKIHRLRALEAQGAEVLAISADVTDETRMRAVIAEADRRFGGLHGLIHAAGVMSERTFRSIRDLDRSAVEEQFGPKIRGLLVLERLLAGRSLDFCALTSSLSSVLGGLGYAAYASANTFMDAFACRPRSADGSIETSSSTARNKDSLPWLSVNWDGWWFGAQAAAPNDGRSSPLARLAMKAREGVEAFERLLALKGVRQVVVSTADLQARLDQWVTPATRQHVAAAPRGGRNQIATAPCGGRNQMASAPGDGRSLHEEGSAAAQHDRPILEEAYVAPRNEIEVAIAEIWGQLFGINRVGIHDNFFELGGHSLLATQLASRLREEYEVEITLRAMFGAPTVAQVAELVERAGGTPLASAAEPSEVEDREEIEL